MEFFLNVSLIFFITVKVLEPVTSCVKDQDGTTCERIEPNSCFSDLSVSLNSLNSLNSIKVLLCLGKNPMDNLKSGLNCL